jgi:hypothetical protein
MRLIESLRTGLRAARVPASVAAKVLAEVEDALARYGIVDDREIYRLPEWNIWLIIVKSILSPVTRLLKREGFCHANNMVVSSIMVLDEKIARLVREWVRARCEAGLDPCCRNPPCCNIVAQ